MAVSSCMLTVHRCGSIWNETADEIAFSRIEANLKMIDFLEKNRNWRQEASILVYGDSKWFQENNYEEICSLLRTFLAVPQADLEPPDAILERQIITKEQEILLKGCWKIRWKDFVLDTSRGFAAALQFLRRISL